MIKKTYLVIVVEQTINFNDAPLLNKKNFNLGYYFSFNENKQVCWFSADYVTTDNSTKKLLISLRVRKNDNFTQQITKRNTTENVIM